MNENKIQNWTSAPFERHFNRNFCETNYQVNKNSLVVKYNMTPAVELSTSTVPATWVAFSHTLCVQQATSHSLCLTSADSFWQISDEENKKYKVMWHYNESGIGTACV